EFTESAGRLASSSVRLDSQSRSLRIGSRAADPAGGNGGDAPREGSCVRYRPRSLVPERTAIVPKISRPTIPFNAPSTPAAPPSRPKYPVTANNTLSRVRTTQRVNERATRRFRRASRAAGSLNRFQPACTSDTTGITPCRASSSARRTARWAPASLPSDTTSTYASFCCSACTLASISCWMLEVDLPVPDPADACEDDPSPTCATDSPFIEALSWSRRFFPAISLADCSTSIMRPCTEFCASSADPNAVL